MHGTLAFAVTPFLLLGAAPAQDPAAQDPADAAAALPDPTFRGDMVRDLPWRNLGPANPMGRVTDIEVPTGRRSTWYVGTAGGGVWKTDNAGTTWDNVFDRLGSVSIGDVATAPSAPDVVWVGTGEENGRNSVQWGDGVYRSTDAGRTWRHMGLRETFQIGHIAIHPTDPDTVYVAALGRLWGDNEQRGVYRTRDGGESWQRVLYLDPRTGCIDVRIDPERPDTVYACMFERRRDEFDGNDPAVRFGAAAGLYRSDDGGDNWQQLTQGLPSCQWGRSGIDLWQQDPSTLFLIVETERSGWAMGDRKDRADGDPVPPDEERRQRGGAGRGRGRTLPRGSAVMGIGQEGEDGGEDMPGAILTQVSEDGPAGQAGLQPGDRITHVDDEPVKAYADLTEIIRDSRGGQQIAVRYVRGDEAVDVEITLDTRQRGRGVLPPNGPYGGRLNGQRANVQDYQGELGHETGGVFRSDDRGATWQRLNSLTERPFYYSVIRADPQSTDDIYCVGTSLWASHDGGATFESTNQGIHVDFHAIWVDPERSDHLLAGCDGGVNESFDRGRTWQVHHGFSAAQFYDITADNSVPYHVVGGLQDNGTWIGPSRTRYREGITTLDWMTIYGGDGFGAVTDPAEPWIVYATSQNGALGMVDLRSQRTTRVQRQRPEAGRANFNWDSPFVLSPHNRLILWSAGEFLYRADRGAPPRRDPGPRGGGRGDGGPGGGLFAAIVSPRLGRTEKGTATALAESPLERGLLYVGTDDGALWCGAPGDADSWVPLHDNLPAMPGPRYVSDIVPSAHDRDRVYVTLDGHRSDDFRTYVFVSEDRGATWRSLATDLPVHEPCFALAEDPQHEDLLFLGTEYGCYVSLDRGAGWLPLGEGLPVVAVRDLFLHDRDSDLIAGTHGRGAWVVDVAPLRQLTAAVAASPAHLFQPQDGVLWRMTSRGLSGNRDYRAPNPDYGVSFYVWLRDPPERAPAVTVHDVTGRELARIEGAARAGVQRLHWNTRIERRLAEPGRYAARLHLGVAAGEGDGDEPGEPAQVRALLLHPDPITLPAATPAADPAGHPTYDRRTVPTLGR